MSGIPNDAQSKKLKMLWDEGRVSELHYYKSGSFEVKQEAELTGAQANVRKREKELEDTIVREQAKKEDVGAKKVQLKRKEGEIHSLKELFRKAEEEYKDAERLLSEGVAQLPPAQQAQVVGMQRVAEAMAHTAKTFMPCRAELEHFELLLSELQDMTGESKANVSQVLDVARRLQVAATDTEASSGILLKKLGEVYLTDLVMPPVDPAQAGG